MSDKKFNLMILAGGDRGPLYDHYGCAVKALLPVHGVSMLEWVLHAFEKSGCIDNTVIVGPSELDNLESVKKVRKRIFEGIHLIQNIIHAIAYLKVQVYDNAEEHDGYLISFCDAVFLTPEIIQDTLKAIEESEADLVLTYVEKQTLIDQNLPIDRTFINIEDKFYTGTTIYYLKKFGPVMGNLKKLFELRANRKDPESILKLLGCADNTLEAIEEGLSKELELKVKINISAHGRLGMDVDKPKDYLDALKILENPFIHNN